MTLVSSAIVLFFVMDPLGNIPLFTSILAQVPPERRRRVLFRELLIALGFLLLFLFAGGNLLSLLGLKQEAIRVGGGIVLFLIAIRLIFPSDKGLFGDAVEGEPLVFPLAVPLIAGPSAFATVLLLTETGTGHTGGGIPLSHGLLVIVSAWAVSALILSSSTLFLRLLGKRGLMAGERLMGMLLVMLSVQMVLEGVANFLSRPS